MSDDSDPDSAEVTNLANLVIPLLLFVPVLFWNLVPDWGFAPLGRPPVNVFCALFAVLAGVLDERDAFAAIDVGTLMFLIGMMLMAAYLEKKGLLERFADSAFKDKKPLTLLVLTALFSGIFAAVITNDGVCMLITPLVVKTCLKKGIDPFPFLVAICTSANVGSGAVLSGNPQNILIGHLSQVYLYRKITWLEFLALSLPAGVVGLLLNTGLLVLYYKNDVNVKHHVAYVEHALKQEPEPATYKHKILYWVQTILTIIVMVAFIICFAMGLSIELVTLLGSIMLVIVDTIFNQDANIPKILFAAIQWDVILVFGALFIVVHVFNGTHFPHTLWTLAYPLMTHPYWGVAFFSVILIFLSTLVSNVPVVMMVGPEMKSKLAWVILAWAITVGGNFAIISSAANIIVDEKANSINGTLRLEAWKYFKFGIVTTTIVALSGSYIIYGLGQLYGYDTTI